jgi:hypothetical protein
MIDDGISRSGVGSSSFSQKMRTQALAGRKGRKLVSDHLACGKRESRLEEEN